MEKQTTRYELTLLLKCNQERAKTNMEDSHLKLEQELNQVIEEMLAMNISVYDPDSYNEKFELPLKLGKEINSIIILNLILEGFQEVIANRLLKLKPLMKKFFPEIKTLIARSYPEMKTSETTYNQSNDVEKCKYYRQMHRNRQEINPENYANVMKSFTEDPEKYMRENLERIGFCLKSGEYEPNCKNCLEIDILGRCCEGMIEAIENGFLTIENGGIIFNKGKKPLRAFNVISHEEYDPNEFFMTMTLKYCPFCQTQIGVE